MCCLPSFGLSAPPYNKHTSIVEAFDINITRAHFARLKDQVMLSEEIISWMLHWWSGEVEGGVGRAPRSCCSSDSALRIRQHTSAYVSIHQHAYVAHMICNTYYIYLSSSRKTSSCMLMSAIFVPVKQVLLYYQSKFFTTRCSGGRGGKARDVKALRNTELAYGGDI